MKTAMTVTGLFNDFENNKNDGFVVHYGKKQTAVVANVRLDDNPSTSRRMVFTPSTGEGRGFYEDNYDKAKDFLCRLENATRVKIVDVFSPETKSTEE